MFFRPLCILPFLFLLFYSSFCLADDFSVPSVPVQKAVITAVLSNDLVGVKYYIERGFPVDLFLPVSGAPLVFTAAVSGAKTVLTYLMTKCNDHFIGNVDGENAISVINNENMELGLAKQIIEILVLPYTIDKSCGITDLNVVATKTSDHTQVPLSHLLLHLHPQLFVTLLQSPTSLMIPIDVNLHDTDHTSLIAISALRDTTDITRTLLDAGADPSAPDALSRLPALLAAANGNAELAVELLNKTRNPCYTDYLQNRTTMDVLMDLEVDTRQHWPEAAWKCPVQCQAGSYGTYEQFRDSIDPSSISYCSACPAGHACAPVLHPGRPEITPCISPYYAMPEPSFIAQCLGPCERGQYVHCEKGVCTECRPCPQGYICPGISAPVKCSTGGRFTPVSSAGKNSACDACPVGHYTVPAHDIVQIEGEDSSLPMIECRPCPRGTASSGVGQSSSCPPCPARTVPTDKSGNPVVEAAVACREVPPGYIIENYFDSKYEYKVKPCPVGTYHHLTMDDCRPCNEDNDEYQDQIAQTSCKKCRETQVAREAVTSYSVSQCVFCPVGFANIQGNCLPCAFNDDDLYFCREETSYDHNFTVFAPCGAGYHRPDPYSCLRCAADWACPGGGVAPKYVGIRSNMLYTSLTLESNRRLLVTVLVVVFALMLLFTLAASLWKLAMFGSNTGF